MSSGEIVAMSWNACTPTAWHAARIGYVTSDRSLSTKS